jgi:RNA polymerase sigma factor (sigma-70 family)
MTPRPPGGKPANGHADEDPLWMRAAKEFSEWRVGDQAALERLVRLLTPALWQVVRSCGLGHEQAEDAVQLAWTSLVQHADEIRDPRSVLRWITTTARRDAWRLARQSRREAVAEIGVLEAAVPAMAGPEGTVVAGDTARIMWRHVRRLTARCQRLLRIIAFDERPDYAAVAGQLGMAVGGVGPTRRRCLDKLRELLTADPEWGNS